MHFVTAVYSFFDVASPEDLRQQLVARAEARDIRGLAIVAPEGLNGTFSASSADARLRFQNDLRELTVDPTLEFKDSVSDVEPFAFFDVKLRSEIVSLRRPDLRPAGIDKSHLSADEWDRVLREESDVLLWDLRNDYEYRVGTFLGAENPQTRIFAQWRDRLRERQIPKEQKILIFCTGGIRCEKGVLELRDQGYENVYQLRGGILKYLETRPHELFEGECVVFDNRVALDQSLRPSARYTWCPHCGNPADELITCVRCDLETKICLTCAEAQSVHATCSKNCRHLDRRDNDR